MARRKASDPNLFTEGNCPVDMEVLASAVHFSHDSIIITNTELDPPGPTILYVNPAFTAMTGYSSKEVLGKNPRILQGPKTDRRVLNSIREALTREEVFYGMTVNYRKDGTEFWNEWHIEPIQDGKGRKTHYLAMQRDVSFRVRMQERLLDQNEQLENKNVALKEILGQIEIEKKHIQDDIRANVEQILMPAFQKLQRKGTRFDQKYLHAIEASLAELTSSFGTRVSEQRQKLSPREVEIANLIKNGMSNKEISQALNISIKTVETHRNKIRHKFKILNQDINLTTYLQSL